MKRSVALLLSFVLLLLPCLTLLSGCGRSGKDAYRITFSVGGKKTAVEVKKGEIPEYPGETSWETSEHYCKITGWDKEFAPATSDETYTAIVGEYGLTLYDVIFVLPTGSVTVKTHEGEIPTPPEGYETDDTKADKFGTFRTWDKPMVAPTAENTQNGTVKMTYKPIYTYEPKYLASILPVKDGAKGIFTMTYDDGQYYTAAWVNEENKKYGLAGSCMLIADRSALQNNLAEWRALFADGTLEPQSHSMSHDTLPDEGSGKFEEKKGNNTQPKYRYELVDAKTKLEQLFPGRNIICFAPASNTLSTYSFAVDANGNADFSRPISDGGAQAVAQATYYAIRKGHRGIQSLDPTFDAKGGGWYNLCIQAFSSYEGAAKLPAAKSWLDDTVKDGGWLIVMCHGIDGPNARGTSPIEITETEADAFFAYAGEYVKSGEIWAATFGDATKYIRERQNTTVAERYEKENGVVYLDMTINRTAKDGKILASNVFNYPLTVEARVPDAWKTVRVTDGNGKIGVASVYVRDGASYVMVNLVPGADGATVTTELRAIGTK